MAITLVVSEGYDLNNFETNSSFNFSVLNEGLQNMAVHLHHNTPALSIPISDICNAPKRMKTTADIASNNVHVFNIILYSLLLLRETKI